MKIYLASYLEPQNFGNGRIFGATDNKPGIQLSGKLSWAVPPNNIVDTYNHEVLIDRFAAIRNFENDYRKHLNTIYEEIKEESGKYHKNMTDFFDLRDGDTICSWERANRSNYRHILAEFLIKVGYEVNLK